MEKKHRKIYLFCLIIGFAWTLYVLNSRNISVNEAAWIFWAFSFSFSPLFVLLSFLYGIRKLPETQGSGKKAMLILGQTGLTVILLAVSVFAHSIIGAFISVVLAMEPHNIYGPNGYINNFELAYLRELITRHPELGLSFLSLKSFLLLKKKNELEGAPGLLTIAAWALVFGAIARLLNHFWPYGNIVFVGLLFFPWSIVVDRDIIAKARAQEADLNPKAELPAHFVDRGSPFWGSVFLAFGLVFLALSPLFFVMIWKKGYELTLGSSIAGGLFLLAFGGFGIVASLVGSAMIFGYTKVSIYPDFIRSESRFRHSIFKLRKWQESHIEFKLEKSIVTTRDSDGPDYTTYRVIYRHNTDKKKNIDLYRSYHPEGFEEAFTNWEKLLKP